MSDEAVRAALTSQYVQNLLSTKSYHLCRRPTFRQWERPDIEQDLIAHILKQAHHFDPSRACVNTFVARVVDSAVAMMIRDRARLKRGPGKAAISLDRTHVRSDPRQMTLSEVISAGDLCRRSGGVIHEEQQEQDLTADLGHVFATLAPLQQRIALRLMEVTEAVVARELGISRRQVRNAVEAISQRLDDMGFRAP